MKNTFTHLIAIFVINHKSIKNEIFNFSNKYKIIIEDANINTFQIKNISENNIIDDYNLRVIVGENGCGKTSVLECLRKERRDARREQDWYDERDACIYFFASEKDEFMWYYRGSMYEYFKDYMCFDPNGTKLKKPEDIYYNSDCLVSLQRKQQTSSMTHIDLLNLYSNYGTPLFFKDNNLNFNKFTFVLYNGSYSSGFSYINNVISGIISKDIKNTSDEKTAIYFIYFALLFKKYSRTSSYKENKYFTEKLEGIKTLKELESFCYNISYNLFSKNPIISNISIEETIENIKKFFNTLEIEAKLENRAKPKITSKFDALVKNLSFDIQNITEKKPTPSIYINDKIHNLNIPDWFLDELFEIEFFKHDLSNNVIKFSEQSSGEREIINMFAELFGQIDKKSDKGFIVTLDEPTNSMHPEWQRQFIYYFNDFIANMPYEYKFTPNGKKRIENVIITTHSPFILTDISQNETLFLSRNGKQDTFGRKTFAANIHALLARPFFMNGTIGKLATNKINELVKFYNTNDPEKIVSSSQHNEYQILLNMMDDDNLMLVLLKDLIKNKTKIGITNEKI